MKVSINWIKDYVDLSGIEVDEIVKRFNLSTAEIEGVDLVTEGVITINKVIEYAKDALNENKLYDKWSYKRDGASLICRLLFEEATDINFYVGRAVNPAHQNPDLPITFNIKMNLVEELSKCLKQMGKRIKISYF